MSLPVAVKSGRFAHAGHQLAYEVYGEDGIPCLLMHGLLLDSQINRALAQRFAEQGYRVVLLDLLGHGNSDKPTDPREHRVDFYAGQALACLDHLGMEQALVGGVSLGAITALQLASQAPQRCLGLFLEMPVMEWSTTFAAVLLVPALTVADYGKWIYRPWTRLVRKLPRPRSALLASALNTLATDPAVITAVLHGLLVGPVVPPSSQRRLMQMPALVIGHAGDRLHSLRDAVALARELPRARLLKARSILELRLRPERLWPDIRDFLVELRVAARPRAVQVQPGIAPASAKATAPSVQDAGTLRARFEQAVQKVRTAPPEGPFKPSNELKLKMYGLYRQATDGDVQGKRPGITDPIGRFKYDAWALNKGMSPDAAMQAYLAQVESLERKLGAA